MKKYLVNFLCWLLHPKQDEGVLAILNSDKDEAGKVDEIKKLLSPECFRLLREIAGRNYPTNCADGGIIPLSQLRSVYSYDGNTVPFSYPFLVNGKINITHKDVKTLRRNLLIRIGRVEAVLKWDDGSAQPMCRAWRFDEVEPTRLGMKTLGYAKDVA